MNKLIIIGRVGKDCQVSQVNGKSVGNFSVAVSKKTQQGESTIWVDVALWDRDKVYQYIRKGGLIMVEGEATVHSYTKNDGTAAASLRLSAYQVELLGGGKLEGAETAQVQATPDNGSDSLPF